MILFDTNVVSEIWQHQPNPNVVGWLDSQNPSTLFLCTPVLAELQYGAERLPAGKRKIQLQRTIGDLEALYDERILSFDREAAAAFARIRVLRERAGRPILAMDSLIAAIAFSRGFAVATRDVRDFAGLGLEIVNPFEAPAKA